MAHLVGLVEDPGSDMRQLSRTFDVTATGGEFGVSDLNAAKQWLLGLSLALERDSYFVLVPALFDARAESDNAAIALILRESIDHLLTSAASAVIDAGELINRVRTSAPDDSIFERVTPFIHERLDLARRALVGEIGEEVVLAAARDELVGLGRPDLAARARRVSLESDHFGYDVLAPRARGANDRLLEVKSSISIGRSVHVYLTRNEAEVGTRERAWTLVVCNVTSLDERTGEVVGWCTRSELEPLLPNDQESGRWEQARLSLSVDDLRSGLPSAVV